jgi:hypothetical protein
MWPIIAMAALQGGMGYLQAKDRAKKEKAAMLANAEQIRQSPWTGMASQVQGPSAGDPALAGVGGALSGGLSGYMMGKSMQATDAANAAAAKPDAAAAAGQSPYSSGSFEDAQNKMMEDQLFKKQNPWGAMGQPTFYGRGNIG